MTTPTVLSSNRLGRLCFWNASWWVENGFVSESSRWHRCAWQARSSAPLLGQAIPKTTHLARLPIGVRGYLAGFPSSGSKGGLERSVDVETCCSPLAICRFQVKAKSTRPNIMSSMPAIISQTPGSDNIHGPSARAWLSRVGQDLIGADGDKVLTAVIRDYDGLQRGVSIVFNVVG
jgi:hypothetical protein